MTYRKCPSCDEVNPVFNGTSECFNCGRISTHGDDFNHDADLVTYKILKYGLLGAFVAATCYVGFFLMKAYLGG